MNMMSNPEPESRWTRMQPGFLRRMSSGYKAALGILVLVVLWVASGVIGGGHKPADEASDTTNANTIPRVQVSTLVSSNRNATITIRGR